MTYQIIANQVDAIRVLESTTEREAIHAAIYMTLPPNGDVMTNAELSAGVHQIVDPIHAHLLSPSDSYTDVSPTGRRTRQAITSACQTMSERNANKGEGWGLIKRDRGKRSYLPYGYERATDIFEGDKYGPIVDALAFMAGIKDHSIRAIVEPIDTCKELIDQNQEVIDQVAAAQSADKPQPVDPEPQPEPVDGKHPDRDEDISQMRAKLFALEVKVSKIEAYDRTLALVKDMIADRMINNPTGVMADTLKLILESLELSTQ